MTLWRRLREDRKGATAVEYGLLAAMIALVALGGLANLSNAVTLLYDNNNSRAAAVLKE